MVVAAAATGGGSGGTRISRSALFGGSRTRESRVFLCFSQVSCLGLPSVLCRWPCRSRDPAAQRHSNGEAAGRIPTDMPLYDVLNKFQKGSSHMAVVVKTKAKTRSLPPTQEKKSDDSKGASVESNLTTPLLSKEDNSFVVDIDKGQEKHANGNNPTSMLYDTTKDIEDGEIIGIITLEDVFEELLQIVDETDEYVDVHKRIRVAVVAAASSVARAHQLGG